jgi:hypothetical protein
MAWLMFTNFDYKSPVLFSMETVQSIPQSINLEDVTDVHLVFETKLKSQDIKLNFFFFFSQSMTNRKSFVKVRTNLTLWSF